MIQITTTEVFFSELGMSGHLFAGSFSNGTLAIVAGYRGMIGVLSVNLVDLADDLEPDEFFVRLYGQAKYINDECFATGLFEKVGEPFNMAEAHPEANFQKWRLLKYDELLAEAVEDE